METEYGIILRGGGEPNPIAASSALINAYVASLARRIEWDFQDESPARDARGFVREPQVAPEVETHLVNAVLTNGARYYVDHAHPEYSGPSARPSGRPSFTTKPGKRSWPVLSKRRAGYYPQASRSACTRTIQMAKATRTAPTRTT